MAVQTPPFDLTDDAPPRPPARVAVIDPHVVLRFGIRQLLAQGDRHVCWEAGNSSSARALMDELCPDLIIYEPIFEMGQSMVFLSFLRTEFPNIQVIVLTMAVEAPDVGRFLNQGVLALVSKLGELRELLHAIELAKAGQVYVSPHILNGMHPGTAGPSVNVDLLSVREREVFRLVGLGQKASEIAGNLGISPRTVDAHKQHIKDKLSLNGSIVLAEAARAWIHRGWVQPGGNDI